MEFKKKISSISILLIFCFVIFTQSIYAQTQDSITIDPIFQEVTLSENDASASAHIVLLNTTSLAYDVTVTSQEIESMDVDGNIILRDTPLSGNQGGEVFYLRYSDSRIPLLSQEKIDIPIEIRNTQELSPGGHYLALTATLTQNHSSTSSGVLPALTSFILLRKLGGERYHLSLNSTTHNASLVSFPNIASLTFENVGNIHTTPRGMVQIFNIFGTEVARGIINEGSSIVLPQSKRLLKSNIYTIQSIAPLMIYKMKVYGTSDPGNIAFQSTQYFVLFAPKRIIAMVLCGIFLVLLVRKKRRKT